MLPLVQLATVLLLSRAALALEDDPYIPFEDYPTDDQQVERRAQNSNYLRFGRTPFLDYEPEDEEDFARPTRSGKLEKNDHFIRFGRGRQDFLRFGRDSSARQPRSRSDNHLRFGRKKRDTAEEQKRTGSNYLRFGRNNSNFLRFGRGEERDLLMLRLLKVLLQDKQEKKSEA